MRCGCPHCGTFMVHEDGVEPVCVCPDCGYRCNACLGTGTVITREALQALRETEWFHPQFDGAPEEDEELSTAPEPPEEPD